MHIKALLSEKYLLVCITAFLPGWLEPGRAGADRKTCSEHSTAAQFWLLESS